MVVGVHVCYTAIAEQIADENGLAWPSEVAPWDIHLVPIKYKTEEQCQLTDTINQDLEAAELLKCFRMIVTNVQVLEFADSDLNWFASPSDCW